jgi:hypothetical protein
MFAHGCAPIWYDRAHPSDSKNRNFDAISFWGTFPDSVFDLKLSNFIPKLYSMITLPFER